LKNREGAKGEGPGRGEDLNPGGPPFFNQLLAPLPERNNRIMVFRIDAAEGSGFFSDIIKVDH